MCRVHPIKQQHSKQRSPHLLLLQGVLWPTTPLIYAAKMGHVDMVAMLMDRGAQVAATYKVWGCHKHTCTTALAVTATSGWQLEHGAAATPSPVLMLQVAWQQASGELHTADLWRLLHRSTCLQHQQC